RRSRPDGRRKTGSSESATPPFSRQLPCQELELPAPGAIAEPPRAPDGLGRKYHGPGEPADRTIFGLSPDPPVVPPGGGIRLANEDCEDHSDGSPGRRDEADQRPHGGRSDGRRGPRRA